MIEFETSHVRLNGLSPRDSVQASAQDDELMAIGSVRIPDKFSESQCSGVIMEKDSWQEKTFEAEEESSSPMVAKAELEPASRLGSSEQDAGEPCAVFREKGAELRSGVE